MHFIDKKNKTSKKIIPLTKTELKNWLKKQSDDTKAWIKNADFSADSGNIVAIPTKDGDVQYLYGLADEVGFYSYAALPQKLPNNKGGYFIERDMSKEEATIAAMGWEFGQYSFDKYKSNSDSEVKKLLWPKGADKKTVEITTKAIFLIRDLINTPTNDMNPAELAKVARSLTKQFNAKMKKIITGDELLKENYPAIHAVGRASDSEPRLIDFTWGDEDAPKVTLVGKGVCYDTGGLNLKPGNSMALMKKDMGGAAHVLGLAQMIMEAGLPVRLRVLIPAVENSVSGNAMRPGDIISTRKGLSVEIGNTDAEGRLVLADALAEACTEKPDLLMDFATLTGAARVALGPELPPIFTNDDKLAEDLQKSAHKTEDPLWRLPLWKNYEKMLDSDIADTDNTGSGGMAGAITAALFLQKFIEEDIAWVHIDTYGWNPTPKAGRPKGGEAYAVRASFDMIKKRFGTPK